MRKDLDQALCTKYPEIFRDRHKPMSETAMCWGFSCGDGWYPLINTLCKLLVWDFRMAEGDLKRAESAYAQLQTDMADLPAAERANLESLRNWYTPERIDACRKALEKAQAELPVATQVKEKFGGLRFYVTGGSDRHYAYIRMAEAMSYTTCEECGATQGVYRTSGWVHTTCRPCAAEHNLLDRLIEDDDDE